LPLDIASSPADVFHSSASDPPFWCSRPWVQTLHDVPLAFEDADSRHEAHAWSRRRRPVSSADAVIAVSNHVARVATSLLGLDPDRITVVPHGVSAAFSPSAERLTAEGRPAEDDPYLLLVSEYGPHKGYAEAFAVISALADHGFPHRLTVAGTVAPWWRPDIDRLLQACSHAERVTLTGYVDDQALVELYRSADALVITSRAEGFGLPAIEAMACATPVVAFDNTALPEIVGDGGTLVRDGDVDAFVDTVATLVSDAGGWREASSAAHERSKCFSWEESARAHLSVYTEVARRRGIRK
jgi:glycosyltransferase involved in cell wall biosynthesis